jgi:hypothetical protein
MAIGADKAKQIFLDSQRGTSSDESDVDYDDEAKQFRTDMEAEIAAKAAQGLVPEIPGEHPEFTPEQVESIKAEQVRRKALRAKGKPNPTNSVL